jgi:4-amino-4-deoxy-L-arabinose transferase-like glycosyltransferase
MSRQVALLLTLLLALAHAVLAWNFANVTPYRQGGIVLINPSQERDIGAPDERQHANYIQHLIEGKGFPVFRPGDPNLYESYQSHQPPLYYLVAQALGTAIGVRSVESRDDGLRLRTINCLIGAVGVLGVFFLGLWGFGKPEVGFCAAAVAGLLPMNVALSGAIGNDPLLITLCTWALALMALGLRQGWTWGRAVGLGLLIGAACLTKTTGIALLPIAGLAALLPQPKRLSPAMALAALGLSLAMVAPWWARNQQLYQDPLAVQAFNQAFQGSAQKSLFTETIIPRTQPGKNPEFAYWTDWVGWWTFRSFIGVFGYMDIWLNETGQPGGGNALYRIMLALTVVLFLGWLLSLGQKEFRDARSVQVLNVAFAVIILVLFLRFNSQYFQAQARYLLPAIGPIAVGFALGGLALARGRWMGPALVLTLLFGALSFVALGRIPGEFEKRIATAQNPAP